MKLDTIKHLKAFLGLIPQKPLSVHYICLSGTRLITVLFQASRCNKLKMIFAGSSQDKPWGAYLYPASFGIYVWHVHYSSTVLTLIKACKHISDSIFVLTFFYRSFWKSTLVSIVKRQYWIVSPAPNKQIWINWSS